jgi:hypothetical protein
MDSDRMTSRRRRVAWLATAAVVVAAPLGGSALAEGGAGPAELSRLGTQALREGRYADAASMFRLSNDMERRVETTCNLAVTYDRWSGHEAQALETYQACAAEDGTGQYRPHAQERIAALRGRLRPPPAPQAPPPAVSATAPLIIPVVVRWQVSNRTSGCFFFSGPGSLGQRDQLGTTAQLAASGPSASLTFAGGQSFVGTRSGRDVSLARRSTHSYGGTWIVDETIQGVLNGDVLVAEYQYRECEAGNPRNCPTNCTIQALVTTAAGR